MSKTVSTSLAVSGDLIFSTVPHWRRLGRQHISLHEQPVIEFTAISRCDSSGVALLLGWLRDAKERGRVVRFAHLPQQLLDVAQVYGVLDFCNGNSVDG